MPIENLVIDLIEEKQAHLNVANRTTEPMRHLHRHVLNPPVSLSGVTMLGLSSNAQSGISSSQLGNLAIRRNHLHLDLKRSKQKTVKDVATCWERTPLKRHLNRDPPIPTIGQSGAVRSGCSLPTSSHHSSPSSGDRTIGSHNRVVKEKQTSATSSQRP